MVELKAKITDAGVFYVPVELRREFGQEIRIIPNAVAAVFFSKNTRLEHVLKSLKIISTDLQHRIEMEAEKHE
jgi:bifunctional DNA-binding transcriptional regulator/antitoxin component of YhaV-PrlF toxin-antitoxin module